VVILDVSGFNFSGGTPTRSYAKCVDVKAPCTFCDLEASTLCAKSVRQFIKASYTGDILQAYFNAQATVIQRYFRGYYSRKYVHSLAARRQFIAKALQRSKGTQMLFGSLPCSACFSTGTFPVAQRSRPASYFPQKDDI
jgi:hypothetical protein